jgi:hypothetical protein
MLDALEFFALKKLVPYTKDLVNLEAWEIEWIHGTTFVCRIHKEDVLGTENIIWARRRLDYDTFNFLVGILTSLFQKQDICMQDWIHVEKRVALFFAQLGCGNNLMNYGEPFGIQDSTAFIIVREFCHVEKVHLMLLVIPKLISSKIEKYIFN